MAVITLMCQHIRMKFRSRFNLISSKKHTPEKKNQKLSYKNECINRFSVKSTIQSHIIFLLDSSTCINRKIKIKLLYYILKIYINICAFFFYTLNTFFLLAKCKTIKIFLSNFLTASQIISNSNLAYFLIWISNYQHFSIINLCSAQREAR